MIIDDIYGDNEPGPDMYSADGYCGALPKNTAVNGATVVCDLKPGHGTSRHFSIDLKWWFY